MKTDSAAPSTSKRKKENLLLWLNYRRKSGSETFFLDLGPAECRLQEACEIRDRMLFGSPLRHQNAF